MEKIVVIGPPGAGKTTFAKNLGNELHIKPKHLDRFFWDCDWKEKSRDTRIDILQNLVQEKQWIIEGSNLSASEARLEAADIIFFLNTPILLCFMRIIKRHYMYHGQNRKDIPEGCADKLTFLFLLQVLAFPLSARRKLEDKLREFPDKKVIRLRSAKEMKRFLAGQKTAR